MLFPEPAVICCETPSSGSHGCLAASLMLTSYYNLVCGSRRGELSVQQQPWRNRTDGKDGVLPFIAPASLLSHEEMRHENPSEARTVSLEPLYLPPPLDCRLASWENLPDFRF